MLYLDKFEGADFKYDSSFLKILSQKYLDNAFLVLNLGISFCHEILHLDKLEGADSKYDNSFFKF